MTGMIEYRGGRRAGALCSAELRGYFVARFLIGSDSDRFVVDGVTHFVNHDEVHQFARHVEGGVSEYYREPAGWSMEYTLTDGDTTLCYLGRTDGDVWGVWVLGTDQDSTGYRWLMLEPGLFARVSYHVAKMTGDSSAVRYFGDILRAHYGDIAIMLQADALKASNRCPLCHDELTDGVCLACAHRVRREETHRALNEDGSVEVRVGPAVQLSRADSDAVVEFDEQTPESEQPIPEEILTNRCRCGADMDQVCDKCSKPSA